MKKSIAVSLLILFLYQDLTAQTQTNVPKVFVLVAHHKLNPGKTMEDALAMERTWKLLHQTRKAAGLISDWVMYTGYGANTPNIDYDYVTMIYGTDLDRMVSMPDDMMGLFFSQYPQHKDIWSAPGASSILRYQLFVREAQVGEYQPDSYLLMEEMKVRPENYYEYMELERKAAAAHEERLKTGVITQWTFWRRVLPTGHHGAVYFTTMSEYPSLSAIEIGGYSDDAANKALNMNLMDAYFKFAALREVESSTLLRIAEEL